MGEKYVLLKGEKIVVVIVICEYYMFIFSEGELF